MKLKPRAFFEDFGALEDINAIYYTLKFAVDNNLPVQVNGDDFFVSRLPINEGRSEFDYKAGRESYRRDLIKFLGLKEV